MQIIYNDIKIIFLYVYDKEYFDEYFVESPGDT